MSYLTAAMVLSPNLEAENSWEIQAGLAGFNPSPKKYRGQTFTSHVELKFLLECSQFQSTTKHH